MSDEKIDPWDEPEVVLQYRNRNNGLFHSSELLGDLSKTDDFIHFWESYFGSMIAQKGFSIPKDASDAEKVSKETTVTRIRAELGLDTLDVEKASKSPKVMEAVSALLGREVVGNFKVLELNSLVIDRIKDRKNGEIVFYREEIVNDLNQLHDNIMKSYTSPNFGFTKQDALFALVPGSVELKDYAKLWTTDLETVLKDKGYATPDGSLDLERALSSPVVADGLNGLLGIKAEDFGDNPMYDFVLERIQDKTIGDILTHRDEIVTSFVQEKAEIHNDMKDEEHFGEKWNRFSYATYNHHTDEDEVHFFYRFWRSPLEKLFKHRKIDLSTTEGIKEASRITERLFGESIADYPLEKLMKDWPEHLIEDTPKIKEEAKKFQKQKDEDYLAAHPTVSFAQFLKARRNIEEAQLSMPDRQKAAQNALAWLLKTKATDAKAVEQAKDKPIKDLRDQAKTVIAEINARKRKERAKITTFATITGMVILGTLAALYPVVNGTIRGVKAAKDAVVEKTDNWFNKAPETNTVNAAATSGTATNTADAAAAQAPEKHSFAIKGNRPILGRWTGWRDVQCTERDENAFQRYMIGEFNDMTARIRDKGLPFSDQFDPGATSRHILREHNKIIPSTTPGQIKVPFYIQPQDYDEFMSDVLNFHMNIRDVLDTVPVEKSRLADAQLATMEAIGPSMGWSIKQQISLQKKDGARADAAFQAIYQGTQKILAEHKIDTNDVESVFWATMATTKAYRQSNPNCNYLLLTADRVIRDTAGIELQKTEQFEQLSQADRKEAQAYIAQADAEARAAYGRTRRAQQPTPENESKKSKFPWGWMGISAAVAIYLSSAYLKERAKVVR